MADRTLVSRCRWEGRDLVFTTRFVLADREALNSVRYTLSPDGRTLTAHESFRGPELKYDNVWVMEKQ